jgi:hypothetical protein
MTDCDVRTTFYQREREIVKKKKNLSLFSDTVLTRI